MIEMFGLRKDVISQILGVFGLISACCHDQMLSVLCKLTAGPFKISLMQTVRTQIRLLF